MKSAVPVDVLDTGETTCTYDIQLNKFWILEFTFDVLVRPATENREKRERHDGMERALDALVL